MLNTDIQIIVIKNQSTINDGSFGSNSILSTVFPNIETLDNEDLNRFKDFNQFKSNYLAGEDAIFVFNFANNIEIEHNYKDLTKKCKVTLPRAWNKAFQQYNMITLGNNTVPLFGRGDRIIVRTGYNTEIQPTFYGYITYVGIGVPLVLECEDLMFFLKTMEFKFSPTELTQYGDRTSLVNSNGQITLNNLFQCALSSQYNKYILKNQDVFNFPNQNYSPMASLYPTDSGIINVYFDLGITSDPFRYTTKNDLSIAEFIADIKKKFPVLCIYFDDFCNLRIGLQYTNSTNTFVTDDPIPFYFEGNIIDEKSMKYQLPSETNVKIIMKSPRTNKKVAALIASDDPVIPNKGYYGSGIGDIIRTEVASDLTQTQLNSLAKTLYDAQVYDGWKKGSSFVTFGTPLVHIGNKIQLISDIYPEKNGVFMAEAVKTTMGLNGYRQTITVGPKIGD